MASPRRFVFRIIGHAGELIGSRYALQYQAIDKLAALVVPQAEMLRLLGESGGNTSAVLAPMAAALKARGYDTLMVLPAQAKVVELHELPAGVSEVDSAFDRAKEVELCSAKLLFEASMLLEEVSAMLSKYDDQGSREVRGRVGVFRHRVAVEYVQKG